MGKKSRLKKERREKREREKKGIYSVEDIEREQKKLSNFSAMSRLERGEEPLPTHEKVVKSGRLHNFMTVSTVSSDQIYVAVPHPFHPDTYSEVTVKLAERPVLQTPNFVDMEIFKAMKADKGAKPIFAHPESTIVERLATALEEHMARFPLKEKVAIVLDTDTFNDLNIETGGGNESSQYWKPSGQRGVNLFLGVPVIEAPTSGDGSIYVISPTTHAMYVAKGTVIHPGLSKPKYKSAVAASSDAVVVSHDPNAHVVSKHFDEDTGDWCIDCWTCGYSHFAWEEEEADELLKTHDGKSTNVFYRREHAVS